MGTLTSPPIKIERKHLCFLIGGGMRPGKACLNLLVGGKVVRTATGPNDRPGGTEKLAWSLWGVTDLAGRTATIQIVGQATRGKQHRWDSSEIHRLTTRPDRGHGLHGQGGGPA